jgi:enoyl-CoA hydratase
MSIQELRCERQEGIALVRLNRPEKLNALSRTLIKALQDLFKQLNEEKSLRAIILTGEGPAFCAGTDLNEIAGLDVEQAIAASRRGQELCNAIENSRIPVIAAVNGIAAGGGCEVALACHIRFASAEATFSLPEIKLGIIPGYGGTQRLAREIGAGRALEMILSGRSLDAQDANQVGLVNRVCEKDALVSEAASLANEIVQLAPLAIRAVLESVVRGLEMPLAEGLELEANLFAKLFASNDMREGTRAFLEKRKPVFNGT